MNQINRYPLGWDDDKLPAAVLVGFDWRTFNPAEFTRQGIALPSSIQRSVLKRQAEFFMGRLAARHALLVKNISDAVVSIGTSREPLWPAGVTGSITHAGGFAAAIAVPADRYAGVGIDIERLVAPDIRRSIEGSVLTKHERGLLARLDTTLSLEALFTVVFSAKESFFKGAFGMVNSYFGFEVVVLVGLDMAGGTLEFELVQHLAPSLPAGRRVILRFGFIDAATVITSFVWRARHEAAVIPVEAGILA